MTIVTLLLHKYNKLLSQNENCNPNSILKLRIFFRKSFILIYFSLVTTTSKKTCLRKSFISVPNCVICVFFTYEYNLIYISEKKVLSFFPFFFLLMEQTCLMWQHVNHLQDTPIPFTNLSNKTKPHPIKKSEKKMLKKVKKKCL